MRKIIVASHGSLALELIKTSKMFTDTENLAALCIGTEDNLNAFKEELYREAIGNTCEEVLILVDLLGGTPFNIAVEIVHGYEGTKKMDIITGVNLPMLLEILIGYREMPFWETVQAATQTGRSGIKSFLEEISKKTEGGEYIECCTE